jgi:hypothetical protein
VGHVRKQVLHHAHVCLDMCITPTASSTSHTSTSASRPRLCISGFGGGGSKRVWGKGEAGNGEVLHKCCTCVSRKSVSMQTHNC